MQTYDPEKAARVWKRVQGQSSTEPDIQQLPEMIGNELGDGAIYLALSRRLQGRDSVVLRQMFQQEQDHAACLKGLYTLLTGGRATVHTPPVPQEPTQSLLRLCYGREMHSLAKYEAWATHPEYGKIFAGLAEQEREHCCRLLELLGRIK